MDGRVYSVTIHRSAGSAWQRVELELEDAGLALPLYHRSAWMRASEARETWFVEVRGACGKAVCGFAVEVDRSRALPGHSILLVQRLGTVYPHAALCAGLLALRNLARAEPRVLRLDVEVFSHLAETRAGIGGGLAAAGFAPRPLRLYADTLAVDLARAEHEIFASLHATARRHVRSIAKHPVEVRPISDVALGPRMNVLLRETMQRTAGDYRPVAWAGLLQLCAERPDLARLVGLFRTDVAGPQALVAYALGLSHGEHVEYLTAASTRDPSLRIPLAYPLAWDLVCWGRSVGARWFDFGGVTAEEAAPEGDATRGIADFKRYFSRDLVRVGESWRYEPHPLRAAVARRASAAAEWLARVR